MNNCKCKECQFEFQQLRVIQKIGDSTAYTQNFKPVLCAECGSECDRIQVEKVTVDAQLNKLKAQNLEYKSK